MFQDYVLSLVKGLIGFNVLEYEDAYLGDYRYPKWALIIGWCIAFVPISIIPIYAIQFLSKKGILSVWNILTIWLICYYFPLFRSIHSKFLYSPQISLFFDCLIPEFHDICSKYKDILCMFIRSTRSNRSKRSLKSHLEKFHFSHPKNAKLIEKNSQN